MTVVTFKTLVTLNVSRKKMSDFNRVENSLNTLYHFCQNRMKELKNAISMCQQLVTLYITCVCKCIWVNRRGTSWTHERKWGRLKVVQMVIQVVQLPLQSLHSVLQTQFLLKK